MDITMCYVAWIEKRNKESGIKVGEAISVASSRERLLNDIREFLLKDELEMGEEFDENVVKVLMSEPNLEVQNTASWFGEEFVINVNILETPLDMGFTFWNPFSR